MNLVILIIKIFDMSIAEMKLAAISEITNLNDEKSLQEVLSVLADFSKKENALNLSQHYENIKKQYGKVLEKLAQ